MTADQVIQIVGKSAIKEIKEDVVRFKTVPKPHPAFEYYGLVFSPTEGLLKIVATGNDITTNRYGESITPKRSAFDELREVISQTYGQPSFTRDNLKAGSIWKEPEDWMAGVLKKERTLVTVWNTPSQNPQLEGLALEVNALSQEKGYIDVIYEFKGWNEYSESKKKAGTVF
jgi:hypothetical protein